MASPDDPHRDQPVLATGAPLTEAAGALILIHGRGADAADILGLADVLKRPEIAYVAPEASGHTWYPNRFVAPTASNEPWLTSALAVVRRLVEEIQLGGIPHERIAILGFSQGACLTLEFAARNARRYGGVIALSGGLIGDRIDPALHPGSMAGTPVFLGCSDVDPHIPLARVQESSAAMRALGAQVTERIYPGAPHTIVADEIEHVRGILDKMTAG